MLRCEAITAINCLLLLLLKVFYNREDSKCECFTINI